MKKGLLLWCLWVLATASKAASPDSLLLRPADSLCTDSFVVQKAAQYQLHPGEINQPALIQLFEDWHGTPYRYGGRSERGIDCSGFVNVLLGRVYGLQIEGGSASIYTKVQHIPREELREGDLVFFNIRKGRISHVGLYLSNDKFIHATVRGGVMLSDLNEPYYKRYFAGAGRF